MQSWQLALINGVQVLGYFMEKSMFQLMYLTLIFVYPRYVQIYSHLFITLFLFLLLLCNGDVEFNPGPKKNKEFSVTRM